MKKALGITRQMDSQGRIMMPAETRRIMNLETGDTVEMFMDDNGVYVTKYVPGCVFCDETSDLKELNGVRYCAKCAKKIKKGE